MTNDEFCLSTASADLETRRYAPEHNVLGNTQNTHKAAARWGVATPRFRVSFATLT